MIAFLLRRALSVAPSLLAFAILLFVAIAATPAPSGLGASEEARRYEHLPVLLNLDPEDRPRVIASSVTTLTTAYGDERQRALDRLLRIGAAGLGDLVATLARLDGPTRARVARDLAPLAFRMGLDDVADLETARAESFWARALDQRGPELRAASLRRALRRHLNDRGEPLYARQLRNADTAVLAPIFDELLATQEADAREELEVLAVAAAKRAGADVRSFEGLRAFWNAHRADYVEYGTLERTAARLTDTRFGRWVSHAVTDRFGTSWRTGEPVLRDLARRAPITLGRTFLALLLAYAIAVPLGLVTAARRYGPADRVASFTLLVFHAVPAFVLALVARAGWPRLARTDAFLVIAIALVALAPIGRHLRSRLLEEVRQDYVRTARATGVSPWALWIKIIGRNAAGPVIAFAAVEVPILLSATLLAEEILGMGGLGPAVMDAVRARDVPWLMPFALGVALLSACTLLASDWVQAVVDPRVRRTIVHHTEDV